MLNLKPVDAVQTQERFLAPTLSRHACTARPHLRYTGQARDARAPNFSLDLHLGSDSDRTFLLPSTLSQLRNLKEGSPCFSLYCDLVGKDRRFRIEFKRSVFRKADK